MSFFFVCGCGSISIPLRDPTLSDILPPLVLVSIHREKLLYEIVGSSRGILDVVNWLIVTIFLFGCQIQEIKKISFSKFKFKKFKKNQIFKIQEIPINKIKFIVYLLPPSHGTNGFLKTSKNHVIFNHNLTSINRYGILIKLTKQEKI